MAPRPKSRFRRCGDRAPGPFLLIVLSVWLSLAAQPTQADPSHYSAVPCVGPVATGTGCLTDRSSAYFTNPDRVMHVDVASFYAGGTFPQGKYDYFATCPIAIDGAIAVATRVGGCWYLQLPLGAPYFDQFGWTAGAAAISAPPGVKTPAEVAAESYRANYRLWSCIHARGDYPYVTTRPLNFQGGTASALYRLKICGDPAFHAKATIAGDFSSAYAGWPVIDMSANGFSGGLSDITIQAQGHAQTAFLSSNLTGDRSSNENGDYSRVTFECNAGSCIAGAMFQDCDTCNYNTDVFINQVAAGVAATFGKSLPSLYGLTSANPGWDIRAATSTTLTFGPPAPHASGALNGYQMIVFDGAGKIQTREIADYDCSGAYCVATLGIPASDGGNGCAGTPWPLGAPTTSWHVTVPAVKSFGCLSTLNYGVTQQIFSGKSVFLGGVGAHFYAASQVNVSNDYTAISKGGSDTFILDSDDSGGSAIYQFTCTACYAEYYSTSTSGSYIHAKGTAAAPTVVASLNFTGAIEYPAAHTAGGIFKALASEKASFARLNIQDDAGSSPPLFHSDSGTILSIVGSCQYCSLGTLTAPTLQWNFALPSDHAGVDTYNAAHRMVGGGRSDNIQYCGGNGYLEGTGSAALIPCSFAVKAQRLAIRAPGRMQSSLYFAIPAGVLSEARYPANTQGVDFNIPIFVNGSATQMQLCFSTFAAPGTCATAPSSILASGPSGKFYIKARASLTSTDGMFTWQATSDVNTSVAGAAFQSRAVLDLSAGFDLLVSENNPSGANVLSAGQAGAIRQ